jgi:hypothetical protein
MEVIPKMKKYTNQTQYPRVYDWVSPGKLLWLNGFVVFLGSAVLLYRLAVGLGGDGAGLARNLLQINFLFAASACNYV